MAGCDSSLSTWFYSACNWCRNGQSATNGPWWTFGSAHETSTRFDGHDVSLCPRSGRCGGGGFWDSRDVSQSISKSQLDELSQQHTFVTWPDVRAALQEDRPLPNSACLLTFDDGVCDHYLNVFRILHERNLSGLFFVLDRRESEGLVLAHKIHFLLAKLGLPGLREAIWEKLNPVQRESGSHRRRKDIN